MLNRTGTGSLLALGLLAGCSPAPTSPAEWVEGEGYRHIRLDVSRGQAGFEERTGTGVDFFGLLSDEAFVENRHRINGAGVAVGDVNGDGLPDLFLAGLEAESRLYLNRGNWQFADGTAAARLALAPFYTTGAAFLDTDGDGDQDLVVTTLDGPSIHLVNNGAGVFAEDPDWPGNAMGARGGTTIAAADIDGDSDLDVYVTNYKARTVKDLYHPDLITFDQTVEQEGTNFRVRPPFDDHYRIEVQATRVMRYEYGEADMLAVNQGGTFVDGTAVAFPEVAEDWGLTAQFRDLDADGDPDLYVANDFESPDHIWMNQGDGSFAALDTLAIRHTSQSSMALDGSDVDRDGDIDIFVTEMLSQTHRRRMRQVGNPPPILPGVGQIVVRPQVMHNTLLLARPGGYQDAAWAMDAAATEWSWAASFVDVDLDGFEDLLVTTGHRYDAMDLDAQTSMSGRRSGDNWTAELLDFPALDLRNVAFRNIAGRRFQTMPRGWGLGEAADVTHGMAFGDLDRDGDLDAVTNRLNGPAGVFENTGNAPRIAVRLRGAGLNTAGIGAKVVVSTPGLNQEKEILAGGQYLSGSESLATFAALADSATITVRWRSGHTTTVPAEPNRLYEIQEPGETPPPRAVDAPSAPAYQRVSLGRHGEIPFEDRAAQPLLKRRLSQEGPFVASGDLDSDGDVDIAVGTGRGGSPSVYVNNSGELARLDAPATAGDVLGVAIANGQVLAAESGYETRSPSTLRILIPGEAGLIQIAQVELGSGSPGPLATADIDGDGDEDAIVGMRFLPGRYPESAASPVLRRDGEQFTRTQELDAGLVTGAAFADVDGDGDQDLALATEWGPARLFLNDGTGIFSDETAEWGLDGAIGLWRGVAFGDVNGDNRPDLIATNWGWNSPYGRVGAPDYAGRGIRLYAADFDRNGTIDPVEAEYAPEIGGWGPTVKLMDLVRGLRYISRRVESAMAYAGSTMEDILGPPVEEAQVTTINQLGHVVWLNTGRGFEDSLLPEHTQRAPVTQVATTDLNRDGALDLVLSQNFFPVLPEDATRQDSGEGSVLFGDGSGGFLPGPPLLLYGDGRGILAADLDGDGRDEIVATQNGAETYVYRTLRW